MIDIKKIASKIIAYSITNTFIKSISEGLNARLIEKVEDNLKKAKDNNEVEYWKSQEDRVKNIFTPIAIQKNLQAFFFQKYKRHWLDANLWDELYDNIVNHINRNGVYLIYDIDFEKSNGQIFNLLKVKFNSIILSYLEKNKRRQNFYDNSDGLNDEVEKQEQSVFDEEKAEGASKVDLEVEIELFKEIWVDEILPKLKTNQSKLIESLEKIFEQNYPTSSLSGFYKNHFFDVEKIKTLKGMIDEMLKKSEYNDLVELRNNLNVLKTRPQYSKQIFKINNLIVENLKEFKRTSKINLSNILKIREILNYIDIGKIEEDRQKNMDKLWNNLLNQVYIVYYKVLNGQITYAKIRGEIFKIVKNNQYAAAIQNSVNEMIAKYLLESLKNNDPDTYELKKNVFERLEGLFADLKMKRIGNIAMRIASLGENSNVYYHF